MMDSGSGSPSLAGRTRVTAARGEAGGHVWSPCRLLHAQGPASRALHPPPHPHSGLHPISRPTHRDPVRSSARLWAASAQQGCQHPRTDRSRCCTARGVHSHSQYGACKGGRGGARAQRGPGPKAERAGTQMGAAPHQRQPTPCSAAASRPSRPQGPGGGRAFERRGRRAPGRGWWGARTCLRRGAGSAADDGRTAGARLRPGGAAPASRLTLQPRDPRVVVRFVSSCVCHECGQPVEGPCSVGCQRDASRVCCWSHGSMRTHARRRAAHCPPCDGFHSPSRSANSLRPGLRSTFCWSSKLTSCQAAGGRGGGNVYGRARVGTSQTPQLLRGWSA